jgi:hypothetical protein
MSLLTVFEGDERSGRPFEMWTGMLGVGADIPTRNARAPKQAGQTISVRPPAFSSLINSGTTPTAPTAW